MEDDVDEAVVDGLGGLEDVAAHPQQLRPYRQVVLADVLQLPKLDQH